MAVFRAVGDEMPKGCDMEPSEAPLPISYGRYLIRVRGSAMSLHCSGQTGGSHGGQPGGLLGTIEDGDSLDTLIRVADEHRQLCEWAIYPDGEREHPELTVQRRVMVHLKWVTGPEAGENFAELHRLDSSVWDAWLQRSPPEGERHLDPAVRLTRDGVSYEMALMAVFRAMGEQMPQEFAVVYID